MNVKHEKTFNIIALALVIGAIIFAGFVGFVFWSHDSSPVDLGKVYSVSQADSMHEVEELLGKPDIVSNRLDNGLPTWTYSHPLKWHAFRVDFSSDGKVIRTVFQD